MQSRVSEELAALASMGARFVKVAPKGKNPTDWAWPEKSVNDLGTVSKWLTEGRNVGLLLGTGNLIDVEYDDDAARVELEKLGLPKTCCYSSGRGQHFIYRLPEIPADIAWRRLGGLEFRIGGRAAQSVLPPSVHPSGARYEWIVSPLDMAPAAVTLDQLGIA
jgi:hypothetical protein